MPLGDISARSDWQIIERQEQVDRTKRSNSLQFGLIGYGLAALILAAWRQALPWLPLFQALLFAVAFLLMPLEAAIYGKTSKAKTLLVAAAVLLLVVLLATFTVPADLRPNSVSLLQLPAWFSVAIPAAMTVLLLWITHRDSGLSHALGLSTRNWGYQAAVGLSLGAALGLHMWVTLGSLPFENAPRLAPWSTMVWFASTAAGFRSLGEELALRGALFRLLAAESHGLRLRDLVRVVILSTPLYIAPILYSVQGVRLPLSIVYGLVFVLLALGLRISQRSIAGSFAANVAFTVFLAIVNLT